jgi:hypothetical protein
MTYACPKCQCDDVRRLSVLFESGLAHGTSAGNVSAWGPGGLTLGSATGNSTSQTALSMRAAPPAKRSYLRLIGYGFVLVFAVQIALRVLGSSERMFVACSYAAVGIGVLMLALAVRFNWTEWPKRYERWQASFMCGRCGHVYLPQGESGTVQAA